VNENSLLKYKCKTAGHSMGCGPICEKCPQGSDVSCAFFLSVSQKYGNLSDVFRKNGEIFEMH